MASANFTTLKAAMAGINLLPEAMRPDPRTLANTLISAGIPDALKGKGYEAAAVKGLVDIVTSEAFSKDDYTETNFEADSTKVIVQAVTEHMQTLPADKRFEFIKTELTAYYPETGSIFESLGAAPENVKTAVSNAIAHNPAFTKYLADKLGGDGGGADLSGIFKNLDANKAGALADIMNTIANGDGYTSVEDFEKLDKVLEATDAHAKLLEERAALIKTNKHADTSHLDGQISAAEVELLKAAKAAGANIPAFAMLNEEMMGDFLKDLFDPRGAKFALGNLADALQLSGADLAAFNQLMGPLAEIMNFMFKPYAELYQKHSNTMGEGISNIMGNAETLFGGKPVVFQASVPADGRVTNIADFGDKFKTATDGMSLAELKAAMLEKAGGIDSAFKDELKDGRLKAHFDSATTPEELQQAVTAAHEGFRTNGVRHFDTIAPGG